MKDEDFMVQKASDMTMTIKELLEAIRIKTKQDKDFVRKIGNAMREIEQGKGLTKKEVFGSLQNPEILEIVQKLVQMDKNITEMYRRGKNGPK